MEPEYIAKIPFYCYVFLLSLFLISIKHESGSSCFVVLEQHILEDLRNRSEIALGWLYQEYSHIQGYMPHTHGQDVTTQRYDSLLCNLLRSLLDRTDQRDG